VNYFIAGRIPEGWTKNDRDRFFHLMKFFIKDGPYLFKYCSDHDFRRCIPDHEVRSVLSFCHDLACGDILVVRRQQPRFFNVVLTGLPYLKMHLSTARVALDASTWVE